MRFNEIQAAIGRVALVALDAGNRRRREIAAIYRRLLDGVVATPSEAPFARPVYHMFVVRVPGGGRTPERRDALARHLKERGIGTGVHYPVPNHLQPAMRAIYAGSGLPVPALPRTEAMANDILSLPMHPELTDDDVRTVADAVKDFFSRGE
jgi:dTDP-4-amino-4,6-dideoxygalactose transaminase